MKAGAMDYVTTVFNSNSLFSELNMRGDHYIRHHLTSLNN